MMFRGLSATSSDTQLAWLDSVAMCGPKNASTFGVGTPEPHHDAFLCDFRFQIQNEGLRSCT